MNRPNIIPPLARFEAHPVRLAIQDKLRTLKVGETITYGELSTEVGWDIEESHHLLSYARDKLLDEGFVYDTVVGVGVKRVGSAGALAIAEGHGRRIRNAAQRAHRNLEVVDVAKLSPAEQMRYGIEQFRIGVIRQFNRRAMVRKIQTALGHTKPAQLSESVAASIRQFGK